MSFEPGKSIPDGYHLRIDGAMAFFSSGKECEICHRVYGSLIGIEKDYPNNPDLLVCDQCIVEKGIATVRFYARNENE